jgi:hypothetical protein
VILITGLAGCSQATKSVQANILGETYEISINSSGEVLEAFTATTSDGKFTIIFLPRRSSKIKMETPDQFYVASNSDSLTSPQEGKEVVTPAYTLQPDGATLVPRHDYL